MEGDKTVGYFTADTQEVTILLDMTERLEIENRLMTGQLRVIKTFEGKTVPVEGVEFRIEGTSIAGITVSETALTDENGEINGLVLPIGNYTVTEVANDKNVGYILADAQNAGIELDKTTELAIENKQIRGNIALLKADARDGETPLRGAEFELKSEDGKIKLKGKSDKDGKVLWENLPYGKYTIRETKAPAGYNLTEDVLEVEITEHGQTVEVTMTNAAVVPGLPRTGVYSLPVLIPFIVEALAAGLFLLWFTLRKRNLRKKEAI